GFTVSKEARAKVEAELLVEASKAFNERAAMIAKSLGYNGFEIERINVGTAGMPRPYRPVAQEAMMMKSAAAPDFADSVGESTLSADANGQVWLRRSASWGCQRGVLILLSGTLGPGLLSGVRHAA